MDIACSQPLGEQQRVIVAAHHDEGVGGQILAGHEPGRAVGVVAPATDADALALTQGIEREPDVLAHLHAPVIDHRARFGGQIARQELAERAFADEADAGGVLLGGVGQADACGDLAHLGLGDARQREDGPRELILVQPVQEVALVLVGVRAAQQLHPAVRPDAVAGVVAGGDALGPQRQGVVQEGLELDLGVAEDVGVRREAGLVGLQEQAEDPLAVVGSEVDGLQVDADHVGHAGRVQPVLARRAVLAVIVVFPVLHEQAGDLPARLFQQPGTDGRIDTAREPYNDLTAFSVR